ncbi:MAG: redox-sensitive transcriptional activator SoxR [Chloroflexi bacterium]|nr:redox-sensitive transcriptional activator SoxR [Chloroflexota bacterium]MCI0776286.1 redox-sensitive transcriptional activator SoxR [Chloroflexota bacterium]MCI0803020.1 redox-sensitive transcriptional activator SoxR [Chloroflexota bacterium]MCI0808275.1 redox-sensitive transcriptional activator SoxR [Chloroflexota bacterium]MCI0835327.1 redox-sensitive transcriptional activator SoxR [Chloroflexota bacterium]
MIASKLLSIGEISQRTGVATSALRFYESIGLINSQRTTGNQRRFPRAIIRRVAVIKAAQRAGIPLDEIGRAMSTLPADRAPTRDDWERFSRSWKQDLERRIGQLTRIKDDLESCIGCGCLSIENCALFNPDDELAETLASTSKLEDLVDGVAGTIFV